MGFYGILTGFIENIFILCFEDKLPVWDNMK